MDRYRPEPMPNKPFFEHLPEEKRDAVAAEWQSDCQLVREHNKGSSLTVQWAISVLTEVGEVQAAGHLRRFLREQYPRIASEVLGPEQEGLDL